MKDSDYVKINSVHPLYLIIDKVNEYTEEEKWKKILNFSFYR